MENQIYKSQFMFDRPYGFSSLPWLFRWPLKVGFRKGTSKFKEQVGHFLLDYHDLIS